MYEAILLLIKVVLSGVLGLFFVGVMRKLAARFQHRIGPPLWQPFLDVIKLFAKERVNSKRACPYLLWGPIISLSAYLSVVAILPLGELPGLDFHGSVIYIIYLMLMGVAGYVIAGFASRNPYSTIGGGRELIQAFGFEAPFIIALLVPTFSTLKIFPSYFYSYPFAFIAFLIAIQGELALPPFHIAHAEQELVAGVYTELSGYLLGIFELAHGLKVFALSSLVTTLFLGGGSFGIFLLKCFGVVCILTLMRSIFARFRIEQSLKLFWFGATPLALIDLARVII